MPQVLRQAVEEEGHVIQPVTDLATHTQHGQAPRLLEVPHVRLSHIAVHEKVKYEADIKDKCLLVSTKHI